MRITYRGLFLFILLLTSWPSITWAQVGFREITIKGLHITLVYPTSEKSQAESFGPFVVEVAKNAPPKLGKQRLIVLSHGTGGSALSDHQLAATLAQAGFLVAQPLHRGDNFKDNSKAGPASWQTRPVEISETIDALAQDPLWSPLFDTNKVGVHGMSAGGASALSSAGAQWNLLTMSSHCAKNLEEDIGFCLNGTMGDEAAQSQRKNKFRLAAWSPEMFLPAEVKALYSAPKDPRIKAITLSVPVAAIFTPSSLAAIPLPVGVISAADDALLLPTFHSGYLLTHCKNCRVLMALKNAGHFDLLAPWPANVAQTVAAQQIRGGSPNPAFQARDRQKAFDAVADFFNTHLN